MDLGSALSIYGPLGVFAALMVVVIQRLMKRGQDQSDLLLKREQDKVDKLEARNEKLQDYYSGTVIPLMERTGRISESMMEYLLKLQEQSRIDAEVAQRLLERTRQEKNDGS